MLDQSPATAVLDAAAAAHRNLDYAFPPFAPGVPMRSVYERAGFEVNPQSPRFGSDFSRPSSRASRRSRKGTMASDSSERRRPQLSIAPPGARTDSPLSPISPAMSSRSGAAAFSPVDMKKPAAFDSIPRAPSALSQGAPMTPVDMPDPMGHSASNSREQTEYMGYAKTTDDIAYDNSQYNDGHYEPQTWDLAPPEPLNPQRYSNASSIYTNNDDPVSDSPMVDDGGAEFTADHHNKTAVGRGLGIDMNAPLSADSTVTSMGGMSSRSVSDARSLYSDVTSPSVSSGHRSNQSSMSQGHASGRKKQKVCRGCNEAIVGRAVASRDEGVSGKWHRGCFRCRACGSGFESGEFYALNDWPYCQTCYHHENGSLCQGCGFGIEGQCLEAFVPGSRPVRFHEQCLSCSECGVPLADEHYSLNGVVYCALHTGALKDLPLVEKRRTRLMMMQ